MDTPVDSIEKLFGPWGHQKWGFMIYRTAYTSEQDFRAMISRIKDETAENLEIYGSEERSIVQQLDWTITEDQDRLVGMSKADVRRIFDDWVQSSEAAAEQPRSVQQIPDSSNARYRFAVQIDQASLDSFTKGKKPFVNLIMRKWPYGPDQQDDDDGDEEEGNEDEGWEAIDGSVEEDVGWCQVEIRGLVPSAYSELCHPNAWYTFYQRPPAIV